MEIKFDGKTALVTGAGKGIGRDVAIALHKGGAKTFALSRTQEDLDSLVQEVPGIQPVLADIGEWDNARTILETLGPIDLLVNNAGISITDDFLDMKPEDFDSCFNVNVKGLINVSQVIVKQMIARGQGGAIVNMSSQGSLAGLTSHTVYCGTKGAVDAVTKVMAVELGQHKIRVNSVNPTVVLTAMGKYAWGGEQGKPMLDKIPLGRFAEVEDVVNPILFLLSDKASMIHGVHLPIDGGFLCA